MQNNLMLHSLINWGNKDRYSGKPFIEKGFNPAIQRKRISDFLFKYKTPELPSVNRSINQAEWKLVFRNWRLMLRKLSK